MEPIAVLDVVVSVHDDKRVTVETVITDDDSSIKAKVRWSNVDWMLNNDTADPPQVWNSRTGKLAMRPDNGELPAHIPEPSFAERKH